MLPLPNLAEALVAHPSIPACLRQSRHGMDYPNPVPLSFVDVLIQVLLVDFLGPSSHASRVASCSFSSPVKDLTLPTTTGDGHRERLHLFPAASCCCCCWNLRSMRSVRSVRSVCSAPYFATSGHPLTNKQTTTTTNHPQVFHVMSPHQ